MKTWTITKKMITGTLAGITITFELTSNIQGAGFVVGKTYTTIEKTKMVIVSVEQK